MNKPLIAIPLGDPAGVGPEIVVKSVASKEVFEAARCVVIGARQIVENAIKITGTDITINCMKEPEQGQYIRGVLNLIDLDNVDMSQFEFGKVSGMCGKAAYEYIAK
ncbi:MAG: 4-phospho-D-threonate 3-dehydrogenase, partial [Lachnospiraceae bacterium]